MSRLEPSPYQPFRRLLLSPEEVRDLSCLRPVRALRDIVVSWSAILAAWLTVGLYREWWIVALAIPVIGNRYYALFILGHDGLHRRLAPTQRTNDLIADLLIYGPIGAITHLNKKNHLLHHQHLATPADPDRHRYGCFNKSRRWEYLFFLTGLASIIQSIGNVFFRRRDGLAPDAGAASLADGYYFRDLSILLGWQIVLIAGLTVFIGWWAYPVLWLLPVYLFTYCTDLVRTFLEHSHPESDAKADSHRLVTYRSNALERMLMAPMNMNYHTVHHLWTSIPYYNLPRADAIIRSRPGTDGLHWRGSYFRYLCRYFLALPLEECRASEVSSSDKTAERSS